MTDYTNISTECGCSKDTALAAAGRGPGCCAQWDEAAVEGGSSSCCGPECCGAEEDVTPKGDIQTTRRHLDIEFLYLDLSVCERCQGTESSLEEALSEVARVLELSGVEVTLQKIHVQTEEQARVLGFLSSPTIRINGRDIQMVRGNPMDVKESPCGCGSALCGQDIYCRDWVHQGEQYATPPIALVADAILREAFGSVEGTQETSPQVAEVPDNLKKFFAAKRDAEAEVDPECCDQNDDLPCYSESPSCRFP